MKLKRRDRKHIYQPLIDRITEAFCEVPYPGDSCIIASPSHLQVCDECRGLHNSLVGKTWQEVLENKELHGKVSHGMSFFTAAGWQYYLPAYLILGIRRRVFRGSLYFLPHSDPKLINNQQERVSLLSADQCEVVVAYLSLALENNDRGDFVAEQNEEALRYWEENLRKAIYRD
jgi:hypothetical protein